MSAEQNEPKTTEAGAAPDDLRQQFETLPARLKADRLKRKLSWDKYAKLLGVSTSTLGKITRGVTQRPHETTLAWLERKLQELPAAQ